MKKPAYFVDSTYPYYICKLKKALYEVKQALRVWFLKLNGS